MNRLSFRCASLAAGVTLVLTGCSDGRSDQNPAIEQPSTTKHDLTSVTCSPAGTSLALSAENTAYDKDCLAAPADKAFTIAFANRQKDVSHNVAVLKSQAGDVLFRGGDPFPGVQTMVYNVPPQPAGEYHFHCEVHPELMQGKFIVK